MKKNLRSLIETHDAGEAQVLVDMNRYDLIESTGMKPDLAHKKSAHLTAAWNFKRQPQAVIPLAETDLSGFRGLTFSVFAANGAGGSFRLMFDNSEKGDGNNGYECVLPISRDGWNDYRVELPFMHAIHHASGWDKIGSIVFDRVGQGLYNRPETVLYIDSMYLYADQPAPLYEKMPELKGAAVFAKSGSFAIVDRKRLSIAVNGADARPFEENGVLWLPMAPVAAGIAHSAVVDNIALTLSFTYRRKKYRFSANSERMFEDDVEHSLGFFPKEREGTLFFPADFVREFFRWRQMFVDPMGLIVLSNRRGIFQSARDEKIIWQLISDLTYLRPDGTRVVNDLRRRFPNQTRGRLLLSYEELMQLRRTAKEDPALKEYLRAFTKQYGASSEAFRAEPINALVAREPQELTADLAAASDKLIAFALLYRMTGDKRYSERAAAECAALGEFKDWNLSAMSSVGTVSFAMALAYDWCHHAWSEARKAVVERAMLRNGMRVGLDAYNGKGRMWTQGGTAAATVNCGMLALGLAMSDLYPETALKLLDRVLRNAESCFENYAPDGGYAEGVGAWEKSYKALVLMIAMLKKACGTDYGFLASPGFAASALYPIRTETANGMWNFHNSAALPAETSVISFITNETGNPIPAWMRRQSILSGAKAVQPWDIVFYQPVDDSFSPSLPLDAVYRKAGLALFRSGWGSGDAFFGLHGGSNHETNGDLDAGCFLLEMGGTRFFAETGGIAELPLTLRRRAIGQNTVIVNPVGGTAPDQAPEAIAPLTEVRCSAERAYAVVDMTATNPNIARAKRGILLCENRTVAVIQDEIVLKKPGTILWNAYTPADVTITGAGKVAKLTVGDKTLVCRLGGIGKGGFETEEVAGCDLKRLYVTVEAGERARISVACKLLAEGEDAKTSFYTTSSIASWGNQ